MSRSSSWMRGGILACLLTQLGAARPPGAPARDAVVERPDEGEGTSALREPEPVIGAGVARGLGRLDAAECLRRLDRDEIAHQAIDRLRMVDAPVRLTAPVGGVVLAAPWSRGKPLVSELLDCRLALALGELAPILARHDVVRVVHYGIYRGDLPWPRRGRPLHHAAGLAIDVAAFVKADGARLDVRNDWPRRPGAATCRGDDPPDGASPRAVELHAILCEIVARGIFHEVLTPNHDASHHDHFHLEVVRDAGWTLVR